MRYYRRVCYGGAAKGPALAPDSGSGVKLGRSVTPWPLPMLRRAPRAWLGPVLALTATWACDAVEPELAPMLEVTGSVTVDGRPAAENEASIYTRGQSGYLPVAATDGDGRYSFQVPETPDACRLPLIAFVLDSPFPRESQAVTLRLASGPCDGTVEAPDLRVPGSGYELSQYRVSGVVTRNSIPTPASVSIAIESPLWGPEVVGTTTTANGHYVLEGTVPEYYCGVLRLYTEPPTASFLFVPNCGELTVDVELTR